MQPDKESTCPYCGELGTVVITTVGTPGNAWEDEYCCSGCERVVASEDWIEGSPFEIALSYTKFGNPRHYQGSRRVLGLPMGHPDYIATSEKDAMRICEDRGIDFETQKFFSGDHRQRAIEAARRGNVKSGKIRQKRAK